MLNSLHSLSKGCLCLSLCLTSSQLTSHLTLSSLFKVRFGIVPRAYKEHLCNLKKKIKKNLDIGNRVALLMCLEL